MSVLGWIAAAGAAVAAVVYVFGRARTLFRIIEKAAGIMELELTNNSGHSMKDSVDAAAEDLAAIAVAIGTLQRVANENRSRLEKLEGNWKRAGME